MVYSTKFYYRCFFMKVTLDKLNLNCIGIVDNINCNTNIKTRLLDLGIISGTQITPVFKSMLNDPIAYNVRGTIIAIRNDDAKKITIIPL